MLAGVTPHRLSESVRDFALDLEDELPPLAEDEETAPAALTPEKIQDELERVQRFVQRVERLPRDGKAERPRDITLFRGDNASPRTISINLRSGVSIAFDSARRRGFWLYPIREYRVRPGTERSLWSKRSRQVQFGRGHPCRPVDAAHFQWTRAVCSVAHGQSSLGRTGLPNRATAHLASPEDVRSK